jgi:hypothetical protein
MELRRSVAVGSVVTLLVLGGCLSAGGVGRTPTATPTSGTSTASPATGTPTATPGGHESAMEEPAPHKEVRLENEWNRSVEVHVRVVRAATNETVHEGTYELAPGTEREVYDVAAADPDGVEAFTVAVTARGTTERVTVETSACYGNVYGTIREDGGLYVFYAIC